MPLRSESRLEGRGRSNGDWWWMCALTASCGRPLGSSIRPRALVGQALPARARGRLPPQAQGLRHRSWGELFSKNSRSHTRGGQALPARTRRRRPPTSPGRPSGPSSRDHPGILSASTGRSSASAKSGACCRSPLRRWRPLGRWLHSVTTISWSRRAVAPGFASADPRRMPFSVSGPGAPPLLGGGQVLV